MLQSVLDAVFSPLNHPLPVFGWAFFFFFLPIIWVILLRAFPKRFTWDPFTKTKKDGTENQMRLWLYYLALIAFAFLTEAASYANANYWGYGYVQAIDHASLDGQTLTIEDHLRISSGQVAQVYSTYPRLHELDLETGRRRFRTLIGRSRLEDSPETQIKELPTATLRRTPDNHTTLYQDATIGVILQVREKDFTLQGVSSSSQVIWTTDQQTLGTEDYYAPPTYEDNDQLLTPDFISTLTESFVYDDKLILIVGGTVLELDPATGKTVWKTRL